ncbi:MAG: hypothetical protein CVV27_05870, partial [Candidatus Melainabacteria bacterium HGW-Melainabacteria-1]
YLLEALLQGTDQTIIAWVRDPNRLRRSAHPRLIIWQGGLQAIEQYASDLGQVRILVHTATAWGGPDTFKVNLRLSHRLLQALDPTICRQIHLFSTASLLDSEHRFLPQTHSLGTDYIRSKAAFHQTLDHSPVPPSVYYPTVILGGDAKHPATAVSAALPGLRPWLPLLHCLRAKGRLHLIHAQDIARILVHRIINGLPPERLVLGNPALEVNQVIDTLCAVNGLPPTKLQLPLDPALTALSALLQPWMSDWDRFSLRQRHTAYQSIHAASYGLPTDLSSLEAILGAEMD